MKCTLKEDRVRKKLRVQFIIIYIITVNNEQKIYEHVT